MDKRIFKDKAYSMLATMVKAMANARRLEIVDLLGQGEKTVEQITKETGMSFANTSQHLQILKRANLLEIRRDGNFIYHKLAHEEIYRCWQVLRELGMKQSTAMEKLIKDFREQRNGLEALRIEELLKRMQSGHVVLLDVRPAAEYHHGHIPGAINTPIEGFSKRLKSLPKRKEYVAYCRGPFCVFADEAVHLLTKKGLKARRLLEGFPDWKLRGLPVETAVQS